MWLKFYANIVREKVLGTANHSQNTSVANTVTEKEKSMRLKNNL